MKKSKILISMIFSLIFTASAFCQTLVSENFDDRAYTPPLSLVYDFVNPVPYSNTIRHGGSGYSVQFDHTIGGMHCHADLDNLTSVISDGVYFRYYVYYPDSYRFPGEEGLFENLKLLKFASGGGLTDYDIEFIYKNSNDGGPSSLQLFWINQNGELGGTKVGAVSLNQTLNKNQWHKIEIYMQIASPSIVRVQINDINVYSNTNADIRLPASAYSGSRQFSSVRASNSTPSSGHGTWYIDDITVVHNEGDLCDNEPPEPGTATPCNAEPPSDIIGLSKSFSINNGSLRILANWINPSDEDFVGTLVMYKYCGTSNCLDTNDICTTEANPTRGGAGSIVGGDIKGSPGASSNCSFDIQNPQPGTYCLAFFTYDNCGNYSETVHSSITLTENDLPVGAILIPTWDAQTQSGDSTWENSTATWCARVLVEGDAILQSGNQIKLGFQGRTLGDYGIRKVSIAERDMNGSEGDVIDSTWTRLTFDDKPLATWTTDVATVAANTEKITDPVNFDIQDGKSYYITFVLENPATYLIAPSNYNELYFDNVDHGSDIDWSGNGHSVYPGRIHAISKVYISNEEIVVVEPQRPAAPVLKIIDE